MIWHLHTDYSRPYLCLWILMCLPWIAWEVEEQDGIDFSLLHFPVIWLVFWIFLQRPTIALLLHRISHVAHCVYILIKALPLFILLLQIAYVELMVGEMEACTCVTYIAKSNKGSMEITNHTSWWWKWSTPFMDLSPFYLDNMRTWLYYILFFSWTFMCPIFFQH